MGTHCVFSDKIFLLLSMSLCVLSDPVVADTFPIVSLFALDTSGGKAPRGHHWQSPLHHCWPLPWGHDPQVSAKCPPQLTWSTTVLLFCGEDEYKGVCRPTNRYTTCRSNHSKLLHRLSSRILSCRAISVSLFNANTRCRHSGGKRYGSEDGTPKALA